MAHPHVEAQFKEALDATWAILKGAGYTKRGSCFRIESDGNVRIVEFQRSSESSATVIKFTVNLGVISGRLLRKWDPEKNLSNEGVWDAHLRERIGVLTHEKEDMWWTVTSFPVADIKAEVADLVATLVVPFLRQHARDSDLVALWRTGSSPGLTDGQRVRNLSILEEAD